MKQFFSHWCIYCRHLGKGHEDNGRRCIQCLRDTVLNLQEEVDKPLNYEEGV